MVARVKATLDERAEKVVLIRGDQDASYSAIMEAMDSLHAAEIEDIGLITEPKKNPNAPAGGN
jgi:biopolymer transport protein ExbD